MQPSAAQHERDLARQGDPVAAEGHEQLALEQPADGRVAGGSRGHDPTGGPQVSRSRMARATSGASSMRDRICGPLGGGLRRRGSQLPVGDAEPRHGRAQHLRDRADDVDPVCPAPDQGPCPQVLHEGLDEGLLRPVHAEERQDGIRLSRATLVAGHDECLEDLQAARVERVDGPLHAGPRRGARQGWSGPQGRDARDRAARAARRAPGRHAPGCRRPGCGASAPPDC